ncbi:hypothetical protein KGP36_02590, partial [Patescibacteria group bacterium]|nr:hypothetical protein [Patescibacteria group bacterium]
TPTATFTAAPTLIAGAYPAPTPGIGTNTFLMPIIGSSAATVTSLVKSSPGHIYSVDIFNPSLVYGIEVKLYNTVATGFISPANCLETLCMNQITAAAGYQSGAPVGRWPNGVTFNNGIVASVTDYSPPYVLNTGIDHIPTGVIVTLTDN